MQEDPSPPPSALPPAPALADELGGSLRCAACRYALRGLTIKGNCPECGLAIQATLLTLVDPLAAEIQPIRKPRLIAVGVNAWGLGALAAVVLGWAVWGSGWAGGLLSDPVHDRLVQLGVVGLCISGLGALAVIRPHAGIATRASIGAVLGVLLYPVAIFLYIRLGALAATTPEPSLLSAMAGRPDPAPWRIERLAMWLTLAAGAWLLRTNLRTLAARSLVMRAQRVDRQTIAGSVAALGVAATGDLIGLAAPLAGDWGGALVLAGEVFVGLGAVLLTVGMIGIVIDTIRLTPAILQRPLAMSEVLADGPGGRR